MNIFFSRFWQQSTFMLIKDIVEKYKPKYCVGVVEEYHAGVDDFREEELNKLFNLILTPGYLQKRKFLSDSLYKKANPLDSSILAEMGKYELEIMQSFLRMGCIDKSFRNVKKCYYESLKFWNYILDFYKIDIFIGKYAPHEFDDLIVFYLCKVKKIKTIIIADCTLKYLDKYCYLLDTPLDELKVLKRLYDELKNNYEDEDIILNNLQLTPDFEKVFNEYVLQEHCVIPEYMKAQNDVNVFLEGLKENIPLKMRLKFGLKFLFQVIIQSSDEHLIQWLRNQLYARDYLGQDLNAYKFYNDHVQHFNKEDMYIYVPLHVEPECATLPCGGRYENSLLYIEMISRIMPKGYWIYVKEHSVQKKYSKLYPNYRSVEFYKTILDMGNVKLIDSQENGFDLIKNSIAVATVTGTSLFEAVCRSKPCLMFGRNFYQHLPGIFCIKTYRECEEAIHSITSSSFIHVKKSDIKLYLMALEKFVCINQCIGEKEISHQDNFKDLKSSIFEIIEKNEFGKRVV